MKTLVLLAIVFTVQAFAKDNSLTVDDVKARFEVKGEVYMFDGSGKRVLEKNSEIRVWKPRLQEESKDGRFFIESYWGGASIQNVPMYIHHVWTIQNDGSIKMLIEEYAKQEEFTKPDGKKDTRFAELVKKEEKVLENLEQINWVSAKSNKDRRIVVRLTPNLNEETRPRRVTDLPIAATEVQITDNEGNLWLEQGNVSGKYIGFTTHKGSVFLSYYPFKGAREIGVAADNKIELKLGGKKTATLTSKSAFVPADVRAIVYGYYSANQKTERLHAVHTRASSEERGFLESIARGED